MTSPLRRPEVRVPGREIVTTKAWCGAVGGGLSPARGPGGALERPPPTLLRGGLEVGDDGVQPAADLRAAYGVGEVGRFRQRAGQPPAPPARPGRVVDRQRGAEDRAGVGVQE